MSPAFARIRAIFAVLVPLMMLAMAMPATSHADEAYTYRAETCGTNRGSGSTDVNGVMYGACGAKIVRFNNVGTRLADITVGTNVFGSVATNPTGTLLYVSIKTPNAGWRLRRLGRNADGVWVVSTTWIPTKFTLNDVAHNPVPRNLKTDEFGNIYVSNAGVVPETGLIAPTRILKYAPNGTVMTHFGEHNNDPANPYAFFQNRGLTVSRDGRQIFVTSHLQGQIRRFDLQPNGTYLYGLTIGKLDTSCATPGGLSAVSDVGVDPWGYIYAADTTCRKIKKFTRDGIYVATIGTGPSVLHEIGVNRRGDVFAGEWNRLYRRAASNPVPGPIPAITRPVIDVTAPALTAIALPATVTSRNVAIQVTATDAVGIAEARVANEDGTWGAWKPYSNPLPHQLTDGLTRKLVYLQVKDAAGNESGQVSTPTQLVAEGAPVGPDETAPTLTGFTMPATTTTRTINISVTATDNVAVTHVKFANEDGNWGDWVSIAPTLQHTLTAGYGTKRVYVMVRDANWNESVQLDRAITYQP